MVFGVSGQGMSANITELVRNPVQACLVLQGRSEVPPAEKPGQGGGDGLPPPPPRTRARQLAV